MNAELTGLFQEDNDHYSKTTNINIRPRKCLQIINIQEEISRADHASPKSHPKVIHI